MTAGAASPERLARNAALKVAVQATRLLSLALVIATARVLGPTEFGKFTFAYALATLLGVAVDFGIPVSLTRAVARAPATTAEQWAAATRLKLGLLAIAGPILALAPLVAGRPLDVAGAVWLLGVAIALQSFVENTVAVFTGFQRLEPELVVRLVEKAVLVTAGFAALALGGGLLGVAAAFVVAPVVSLALARRLIQRRLVALGGPRRPGAARALARALAPLAQAQLLGFATTRLAPVVVALGAGDLAAGYFGAAFRVYDVVLVLPIAVVAAVYPELARTPPGAPRFRALATQALELLLLAALPVALALALGARRLAPLVYGPGYGPAAPVLGLLGVAMAFALLQPLLAAVFLALDQPRRLRAVAATGFAASVALTPALVWVDGARGGALAVLLVEAVGVGASLLGLRALIGVPLGRGALKALAAAAAGAALAAWLPEGPARVAGALAAYAAGVAVLRPVPLPVCVRLLRGALGRPAPAPAVGPG
jgi:O-antigen/teichoic acid export membrane protein